MTYAPDGSTCVRCARPSHGYGAQVGVEIEFRSITMARKTQTLLDQMLEFPTVQATAQSKGAAEFLRAKGYLEPRGAGLFRVIRMPDTLCRRCFLRESRALQAAIRSRPPSPAQLQREAAKVAVRDREAAWRTASAALGLDPPAEAFECPDCGRWEPTVHAHEVRVRVADATLGLNAKQVEQMLLDAAIAPIRPAYLQRTFSKSYEDAVEVLATGTRVGLLDERGKGLVRAAARCASCYQRRVATVREAERGSDGRDPIPKQLRFKVLQRDGFRCVYCGRGAREAAVLHLDHVVPVAAGGETSEDNLVTACDACNLGKSTIPVIPVHG